MPKTIRNQFDKFLTYERLLEAHNLTQRGKVSKQEVIEFNSNRDVYLNWICEELKNGTYEHGQYRSFYINVPRERKIESAKYVDRVVHRWVVDNFLKKYFVSEFIQTSYAFIKGRGANVAVLDVQNAMRSCKRKWNGGCLKYE